MKGCGKIVLLMVLASILLVYYVQGQISLVRVSYVLDKKMHLKNEKEEYYRQLKYEMEQMKSPRLLESKLSELKFDLALPTEIKVIRIAQPGVWNIPNAALPADISVNPFSEKITNFLERWVKVAQAKTDV